MMMSDTAIRGHVLACFHDEWEVALDSGEVVRASVRARHFLGVSKDEKLLVPGDRVLVSRDAHGSSVIEEMLPRKTALSRRLPGTRRHTGQVIVANADQLVVVVSMERPRLNPRLLDRFLVIAEHAGLGAVVVVNKIDLAPEDAWREVAGVYRGVGYAVIPTCAVDGRGVEDLVRALSGRFSVLAGPSGAGKSSLLNAIEPGLGIRVDEVSEKTNKGKHTTTNVTIFRLADGAIVADTPGFRELGFFRIAPEELDGLFPEFRDLASQCRFRGCGHATEPGCVVKEALAAGKIDPERYASYVKLLEELRADGGGGRRS
jgi:ribosome biogenesis GTPase